MGSRLTGAMPFVEGRLNPVLSAMVANPGRGGAHRGEGTYVHSFQPRALSPRAPAVGGCDQRAASQAGLGSLPQCGFYHALPRRHAWQCSTWQ